VSLTYQESSDLTNDFKFRGKIKVAVLTFADYIYNEASNVTAHNSRYKWAQGAYQQPDMTAQGIHSVVVMDAGIQSAGLVDDGTGTGNKTSAATDAQIQTAVETVVNRII